mgnify:CR=1 FL=1
MINGFIEELLGMVLLGRIVDLKQSAGKVVRFFFVFFVFFVFWTYDVCSILAAALKCNRRLLQAKSLRSNIAHISLHQASHDQHPYSPQAE